MDHVSQLLLTEPVFLWTHDGQTGWQCYHEDEPFETRHAAMSIGKLQQRLGLCQAWEVRQGGKTYERWTVDGFTEFDPPEDE